MLDSTARAMAYIAGRLTTDQPATTVTDLRLHRSSTLSGDVTSYRVFVHDAEADCLITGQQGTDGTLWLLHQGTMRFLTLQEEGPNLWSGFDYASHHSFEISVDARGQVRLLDFQDGIWRTYQL